MEYEPFRQQEKNPLLPFTCSEGNKRKQNNLTNLSVMAIKIYSAHIDTWIERERERERERRKNEWNMERGRHLS